MKPYRTLCTLLVLLLACSACTIPPTPTPIPPTNTPAPPTATPLPPTATPVPPTATPLPPTETAVLKLAEEPLISIEGGFSIRYPEGWYSTEAAGSLILFESEEILTTGVPYTPVIMIEGGPLAAVYSGIFAGAEDARKMAEALVTQITEQGQAEVVGGVQEIRVGPYPAAFVDIAGETDGVPVAGRGVTVHLGDWGVVILVAGQADPWVSFVPTFEAMLASMTFTAGMTPTVGPTPILPSTPASAPEGFLWRAGGESGTAPGQINEPDGLDLGPEGNLYAADYSHGIYVLSPEGEILGTIGTDELYAPTDLKVAPDGVIYVADPELREILVYSPEGELLRRWGEPGEGAGQFGDYSPELLALCPDGLVYASDYQIDEAGTEIERIHVFDGAGGYLDTWILSDIDPEFGLSGMDCHTDGRLYLSGIVADSIMVLDDTGSWLESLGGEELAYAGLNSIAVAPDGSIVVASWFEGWIALLDPQGNLIARWGSLGPDAGPMAEGEFYAPEGIAVDAEGNIYASDWNDSHSYITKFRFPVDL